MVIDHIIDGFVYKVIIVTRGIFFFILLSVVVNISFFFELHQEHWYII